MRGAGHAGIGAQHDRNAGIVQGFDVAQGIGKVRLALAVGLGAGAGLAAAIHALGQVHRQRRRIPGAVLLHQRNQLGVGRAVLHAVRQRIHPGTRGGLAALDHHRVGEHAQMLAVRLFHEGRQGFFVHAAVVGCVGVAPAVGERLDEVRPVGRHLLHRCGGRVRRIDPAGGVLIAPVGAVAQRRAHARGELHIRRGDALQPGAARRIGLRWLVEIAHGGDASVEIAGGDLR